MTIKEVSEKFGISPDTLRYYEKVGMIPSVNRAKNGIRDYTESDISWVQLAICMRNAGLPVQVMIEYLKLYKDGDSTINERLMLLSNQKNVLIEQRNKIDEMLERLDYKISIYEKASKTGQLHWPNNE